MTGGRAVDAMTHFSTREAARILHATEPRVRTWARMGGIVPETPGGRLEFTFQQLVMLRTIRGLLDSGVPAHRVKLIWSSLQRQLPDDLPLTSIRVLAEGKRAIAWDGKAPWQPDSGQFVLDFDGWEAAEESVLEETRGAAEATPSPERCGTAGTPPAAETPRGEPPILTLVLSSEARTDDSDRFAREARSRRRPLCLDEPAGETEDDAGGFSAEQWFRLGSDLESSSPLEARQAYLEAIEADPSCADAHLNLGRLDHRAGALASAEARYRRAIEHAPDDAIAHFNLAVLLEDRRCPHAAVESYEKAVACDPEFADAHYNLGLLLEKQGLRAEALRHLMTAHHLYTANPLDSD